MNLYRWLAITAVLLALGLVLGTPHDQRRLQMPDPWAYETAITQFASGKLTLTTPEMQKAMTEVRLRDGRLNQYIQLDENHWALRQGAGYPLMATPFYQLGATQLANALLAVIAATAVYVLLAAWYDEAAALLGLVLLVWSPLTLMAWHYYHMDTLASGLLLVVAGCLLLSQKELQPWAWLVVAGLLAGWAVFVRLPNVLIVVCMGGYLLWQKERRTAVAFGAGVTAVLLLMVLYNQAVFGSVAQSGYLYPSIYDHLWLWDENPLKEVPFGVQTWLAQGTPWAMVQTVGVHARLWLRPSLLALPFWPLTAVGWVALWRKGQKPLALLLVAWVLAMYAPYAGIVYFGVTHALAVPENQGWAFFVPARYLYPAVFPLVWLAVAGLSRLPRWAVVATAVVYALASGIFFAFALQAM